MPTGYSDDGTEEVSQDTQTPDLTAATGLPGGGGSSVGLMDALSQGGGEGIPQEAILSLLQGPSFGQRMGQAAAGGVAFMRGQPNPATTIIEQQSRQQLGIAQMLQKMQQSQRLATQWSAQEQRLQAGADERKRQTLAKEASTLEKTKYDRNKFLLELNERGLEKARTPEARQRLAEERAAQLSNLTGQPTPPAIIQDWTLPPEDTKDRREAIAQAFVAAENDPQKMQMASEKFGLTPQDTAYWSSNVKSEAFLEAMKIPSGAVLKDRQNQYTIRERQAIESALPLEQRKDPIWYAKMEAMSSRAFPNQPLQTLTLPQRERVFELARLQDQNEELELHRKKSAIDAQQQMSVFAANQALTGSKNLNKTVAESSDIYVNKMGQQADPNLTVPEVVKQGYFQIKPAELVQLNNAAMALRQLEMWKEQITKMQKAGLTSESKSFVGYVGDQFNIGTAKFQGPQQRDLLATFESMKTELINLLRASGDNARAAVLLLPTVNAMSPYAGEAGLRNIMAKLEGSLRAGGRLSRVPELYSSVPIIFPESGSGIPGLEVDENGLAPGRVIK